MTKHDFSYWSPRPPVWLPEYEVVGHHDLSCEIWLSNLPCSCKDRAADIDDDEDPDAET